MIGTCVNNHFILRAHNRMLSLSARKEGRLFAKKKSKLWFHFSLVHIYVIFNVDEIPLSKT